MTVVVDANILIIYGLADEPLHSQANDLLSAWHKAETSLTAPRLFRLGTAMASHMALIHGVRR